MNKLKRKIARKLFVGVSIASAVLAMGINGAVADFPSKNFTYVNPFSPGGESDIVARWQQPLLEEALEQSVTIDYRPGGGGAVGWHYLASRNPDGYTFGGVNLPHIVAQPMVRDAGYETDDLKLIYIFHSTPQVLVVSSDSPYNTLEDFLNAAKESPYAVTVGGTGEATGNHLAAQRLMREADVELTYIPFAGSGPTIPALKGGHVGGLMTNSTVAYQNRDEFRVLAVAWDERLSFFENVPTFREHDLDVVEAIYRGVAVPAKTPDDVVEHLAEVFDNINEELKGRQQGIGAFVHYWGPQESKALVEQLSQEYEELLGE